MNRTKKLLFTLLILVFVICMFTVSASAATHKYNNQELEEQTDGDWKYVILTEAALTDADREIGVKAGDAYTVKYTGTAASVNVPDKLGSASVAFVGYQTFKGNTAIQTVTVGSSVKYISAEAFMDCTGLQQVLISQNVTGINNNAFRNCTALKTVTFHKNSALKNIEDSAFYNCKSLYTFTIPAKTEKISNRVFGYCTSLKEIVIPDSVKNMGYAAFYCCSNLKKVTIGNGIKELLTGDVSSGSNENWGVSDWDNEGSFEGCKSLEVITIGNSVEKIGIDCFAGTNLKNVVIPESVKSIATGAFMNCKNLQSIVIGNGVKDLGDSIFKYCSSLADVKIGSGVARIGNLAFCYCTSLKTITIPSNVTSLGYAAFYCCYSLEEVTIGNGVTDLLTGDVSSGANDNWGISDWSNEGTFEGCKMLNKVTIGNGVRTIGVDCFAGTALTHIVIPDNVKSISSGAFMNCNKLEYVYIGNGVLTIGDSVFKYCRALKDISIGHSVTTIGNLVFSECDSLKFINIPSNVTKLGYASFYCCDSLEKVIIGNGVTALNTGDFSSGANANWGISDWSNEGTFEGCKSLKEVALGSGLISIGTDAFAGTQITSITVPSKVSELGAGAFAGATQLKDIYFTGDWDKEAGGSLFENIAAGYTVHYMEDKSDFDVLAYNKAVFTPITVSFDNNNDDVFAVITEEQIMSPVGGYVIEPIIPAASGYRFVGWYKDSKCTSAWNFETDKVTKNTTLYAKWDDVNKVRPVRPEELTSDAVTGKTISLTWQAVDGATSYNVYVDGKKVNAKAITTSSYTVEKLKADTTYEIEVTAVNSKGESPKSLILAKRTGELSAADMIPVAPTEVKSGKITETEIEITWKAVDGATSYNVYVDGKKVTKTAVAETKYTIPSLKAGTTYVIEVTAVNTVGESPKSKSISATTVAPKYNLGDVDNDGKITAADARFALRMSVNLEKPTEIQKLAADVDGNKNVTAADARIILRISVNLEKIDSYKK